MVAQGYIGRHPGDSSVVISRQSFTASGITTDFTFASGYTVGYFDLYINGVKLVEGSDYTASDSATFTVMNGGAQDGDVLEGVAYKAFNLGDASRIGIQSAGVQIGNAETLNFVGTGNTFSVNGSVIDVSISSAGAGGTWTTYDSSTGITTTKKVKIQNDLEVTGVTTSTGGFSGNLTGNADTATTATNAQGLTGSPSISVADVTASQLNVSGISTFNGKTRILDDVEFHVGTNGASGNYKFYRDSGNTRNILYEDISGAEARFISNIGGDSTAAFRFFKGGSQLARFSVNNIELFAGNAVKFQTTASGIDVTGHTETDTLNVSGICTATGGVQVGSGQSFGSSGASAAVYYGDGSNLTGIEVGLTTEALVANNSVVTLDLTKQDHKITATGICTITVTGGTEADSHTVRLINSGIATVGFSTYFLFPSGSTPSLPEADGSISLLSFTVNRVGAGGTQLLTGASLNYS